MRLGRPLVPSPPRPGRVTPRGAAGRTDSPGQGKGCDTALAGCLGLDGDKYGERPGERLQESLVKVSGFPAAPESTTDRFSEIT